MVQLLDRYLRLNKNEIMKKILAILVLLTSFTFANAQNANEGHAKMISTEMVSESGKLILNLPGNLTKEEVDKRASYYGLYFTVDYDVKSSNAVITMNENTEKSRRVIIRFLAACDADSVIVKGKTLSKEDFYTQYLK